MQIIYLHIVQLETVNHKTDLSDQEEKCGHINSHIQSKTNSIKSLKTCTISSSKYLMN